MRALQLLALPIAAILDAALARQRAEAGEARLAAILDHLPCGVLVRSADGSVVLVNETGRGMRPAPDAVETIGLDQIDGLGFFDAHTGRPLATHEFPTVRALRGEHTVNRELRVELPGTDESAWMQVSAVPLLGPDLRYRVAPFCWP